MNNENSANMKLAYKPSQREFAKAGCGFGCLC